MLLGKLGTPVWICGDIDDHLWFAHVDPWMRPFMSIVPLQRLTAELAQLRGTDPDSLHGGTEPWESAMTAVEV